MDPNRPRPTRGRPRRKEKIRHILFKASTYDKWMKKKFEMGYKGITNSEFAEVLLRCASAEVRDPFTNDRNSSLRALSSKGQARSCSEQRLAPAEIVQNSSPVIFEENQDDGDGDVIGLTEEKSCFFPETSITQSLNKVDPMHGSLSGNPFHSDQSSSACEDRQLPEDTASSPVEIELVLTKSMTNNPVAGSPEVISCNTRDILRKPFTAGANINLSRTRYITLSKERFVYLMFCCVECSGECRIQGKGRGGNLTFRQECLVCYNSRVWSSQASSMPNNKVDNTRTAEGSSSVTQASNENVREEELSLVMETHEDSDEEEDSNLARLSSETANPTYPESPDTLTADELINDECSGEEVAENKSENSSQNEKEEDFDVYLLSSSNEANVSADEVFTDEDRSEELAEKLSENSAKRQQEDSYEHLPSSSDKASESCEEEPSKKGITKKPSQNTIKPVIWCIDCEAVAKMFCVIQRHKKYYCCAECVSVSGNSVENLSLKDFSVHFSDAQGFRMHAIAEHCANLYEHEICKECNKTIKVETDPNKKGHVCEYKIKPFSCNVCHKRFITEIGQKVHYRRLHRDYQHACKYCMMMFDTKQSKLEHEQSHSEDTLRYICPDCPEKFKDFVTRNEHLKTHPSKTKHTCNICDRKFAELHRYERHLRIHSGEKPYKCKVCDRSFNQDGHLKSHMRLHTGEKPFLCEQCGESFNHNISLKNHRQKQHGINSNSVPAEENKQIGRPIRTKDQPGRQGKLGLSADAEMESCESDSDEEQQKRGQKRKTRKKQVVQIDVQANS